jgi:uncharacterized protein
LIKSLIDSVSDTLRAQKPAAYDGLPLFPLGSVLFPDGVMSLKIFEQRYMDMAKKSLKDHTPFGIVLIREGEEVGAPADPHDVGTLAHIDDWDMENLGVLQVKIKGRARFRINSKTVMPSGLIVASVTEMDADKFAGGSELTACAQFLKRVLVQINAAEGVPEERFADASWVSFRLTELLPFSTTIKQKMLELTDAKMRLEVLHRFLNDQGLIEKAGGKP